MDASAYFKGKKITVMGLGLLGRGAGDAAYLAECGAELIVTDLKSPAELADSVVALKNFQHITFVLGEHRLEDFRERDLILKAAGVPLDSPYIAEARANGIPVRMSADLFMEYSGVQTIGVTGTRGKSTVTHMIAHVLEAAGGRILLGGNIRGVSTLALLKETAPKHVAVLELDSWQCQGLAEAKISPHVAVFTTFYPDHLNYYRGDLERYLADKANIFLYQEPGCRLVLGEQCASRIEQKYPRIKACVRVARAKDIPADWALAVPGEHNRYNAACALAAVRLFGGVSEETMRYALETFTAVSGRLEFLREIGGVKIYNDTNATTPEATLAALSALAENYGHRKSIILIMGGADKGLDMRALLAKLPEVKKILLLAGSGTERIRAELPDAPVFGSLEDAFAAARSAAAPRDIILFSPAFASFGMFANEYERGDRFTALVRALS